MINRQLLIFSSMLIFLYCLIPYHSFASFNAVLNGTEVRKSITLDYFNRLLFHQIQMASYFPGTFLLSLVAELSPWC